MKEMAVAARKSMASRSIITYDHAVRRLWLCGQRVHHGATGAGVATVGAVALAAHLMPQRRGLMALLVGTALMIHDVKDRRSWFQRGWQAQ